MTEVWHKTVKCGAQGIALSEKGKLRVCSTPSEETLYAQALKDMDTETLRKILGDVNLPSWINFPGMIVLSHFDTSCHAR